MTSKRPRGRKGGEKNGKTRREILFYIYDHEEGVERDEIYAFCRRKFSITDNSGIRNHHLNVLEEKKYILPELRSGNTQFWKPNADEKIIQAIWKDHSMIWGGIPSIEDICTFTSTKAMRSFIRETVVPEFKTAPVSRLARWKSMYSRLPSREDLSRGDDRDRYLWREFDDIILWAHLVNPCLISHHFDRQRDLILFTTFTLADFFGSHDISKIWDEKKMYGLTHHLSTLTRHEPLLPRAGSRRYREISQELIILLTIYLSFLSNEARFGEGYYVPYSQDSHHAWEQFRQLERLIESCLETLDPDSTRNIVGNIHNIGVVISTLKSFMDAAGGTYDPRIFLMNA
ncbi:hypothetical protein [Methanoculleus sp.]|nr:hypothetical protein [Methanoculleus sp.]